jgi:hypothetical protein
MAVEIGGGGFRAETGKRPPGPDAGGAGDDWNDGQDEDEAAEKPGLKPMRQVQAPASGRKSSARPFRQCRLPVGSGPSSKTWPKWPPQRRQCTSVRAANSA